MAYPEVQAKIQQEIDEIVGRNRLPRLAVKPQLPYTEATILEVQRLASIVAVNLPHRFSEDTSLLGYDIPKGTMLIANLWAVSRDPSIWSDPNKFNPERFLDEAGSLKPREEHLPFSTGNTTDPILSHHQKTTAFKHGEKQVHKRLSDGTRDFNKDDLSETIVLH